jgi:hypothetical protein
MRGLWPLLCALGFGPIGSALADEPRPPSNFDLLDRDYGWSAGTIQLQLERDATMIPFGKGAIFVPAMTNPLDEPPVAVLQAGSKIAEGTTGARIVLSPGTYEIRVGSGAVTQQSIVQVSVREKNTTVVPVSWAGLQIHVVDEQYGSLRGSYELIRVSDREYMGIGFGTDEQAGEPVSTWVLKPGLYKVVRAGDNYRARRDFATVRLVEGKLTHFLLVLDRDTGEQAGAGEVPEGELFRARDGFFGSFLFGGDLSLNHRQGSLLVDGLSFAVNAFVDSRFSIEIATNPLLLQLQVEEGLSKGPDLPWVKTKDRIDLDALYVYRLYPWLGPYARLGAESNIFNTDQPIADDGAVIVRTADGADGPPQLGLATFRVSPPFGLVSLKEGGGINVRVLKTLFAETNLRTGVGARHRFARDLYQEVGNAPGVADGTLTFQEIESSNLVGVEATVLALVRPTRFLLVNVELDSLVPFTGLDQTVLEIEASAALKITSYLSLNYVVRYLRDRVLLDEDRIEQDILLRFSVELL